MKEINNGNSYKVRMNDRKKERTKERNHELNRENWSNEIKKRLKKDERNK